MVINISDPHASVLHAKDTSVDLRLHLPMIKKGMTPTMLTNLTPHKLSKPMEPTMPSPAARMPANASAPRVETGLPPVVTRDAYIQQRAMVAAKRVMSPFVFLSNSSSNEDGVSYVT